MTKKKAEPEKAETLGVAEVVDTAQVTSGDAQGGVDIKETPLGGVEGDLVYVDAVNGLNLREGPAISFPVTEVLADGSVVAVLTLPYGAEIAGWALVHTGQRTGWVDCHFIHALKE